MTKELVRMCASEVEDKFKDCALSFDSYYKHEFKYVAQTSDGFILVGLIGGERDDIYRLSLNSVERVGGNVHAKWRDMTISKRTPDGDIVMYESWSDK